MNQFNLQEHNIVRPEKVIWRIPEFSRTTVEALELIKSSSQKKFLQNIDEILIQNQITWELVEVDKQRFLEWLPYYEARMSEHEYRILADEQWYDTRISEGKKIEGMFFYQNDTIICSGMFLIENTAKATFAFKASDRIDLTSKSNSSIGSVIDYFFLKEMLQRGIPIISAGKSRNAFGVHNTFGYLEYKLRFGYYPFFEEGATQETEVPVSEDGSVAFFAQENSVQKLFYIHPAGITKELQALKMLPEIIQFKEITY